LVKLIATYIIPSEFSVLLGTVGSYLFGFYYLRRFKPHFKKIMWLMPVAVVLRLICKLIFDGTSLYNEFLTDLCHKFLALTLIAAIYTVSELFYKKKINVIAEKVSGYTYEFYLVHYPVVCGPIAISCNSNYILFGTMGFIVSGIMTFSLHQAVKLINRILGRE